MTRIDRDSERRTRKAPACGGIKHRIEPGSLPVAALIGFFPFVLATAAHLAEVRADGKPPASPHVESDRPQRQVKPKAPAANRPGPNGPAKGARGTRNGGAAKDGGSQPAEPTIALPAAGKHSARDILSRVQKLTGRRVLAARPELAGIPIEIHLDLSRRQSSLEELRLLLAAHKIYLHSHTLPGRQVPDGVEPTRVEPTRARGEAVWVASGNRFWESRREPSFTRIFAVSPRLFNRAVEEIDLYLTGHNHGRPDAAQTTFLPIRRSGRIVVRSPSSRPLDAIGILLRGLERARDKRDAAKPRLYSWAARNCKAAELTERLWRFLDEAEAERVHVVLPRSGNVIWFRAPPSVWAKIEKVLPVADSRGDTRRGRR